MMIEQQAELFEPVPKLKPFFSYFGGKWRDIKRYSSPQFDTIIEPFAGSAGYSVRNHTKRVILCEKDPIVASVWEYLIDAHGKNIKRIAKIPNFKEEESVDDLRLNGKPLLEVEKWLIGFWLNRGVSSPRKNQSKWMRELPEKANCFWGDRVRETLIQQMPHIRHWQVFNCSYEYVFDRAGLSEKYEATFYVDPPYQVQGKHYRHGASDIDYDSLGNWCRKRRGQVIVCENEGADWLDFKGVYSSKTTRRNRKSREVIWENIRLN